MVAPKGPPDASEDRCDLAEQEVVLALEVAKQRPLRHLPTAGGVAGQVVFHVFAGALAARQSAIDSSLSDLSHLHDVIAVTNPFTKANTMSSSGKTAFSTVTFSEQPALIASDEMTLVDEAVRPARSAGVDVTYGAALGTLAEPKKTDARSELIGFAVALVVLLVGFGSLFGGVLPLVGALLAVLVGVSLLGLVAATSTFATVSPTLATMIGLGVKIDYSLFLATRYRQKIMHGLEPVEAAAASLSTSGRSVLIAASTVVIALLGLYASAIVFIGKLGVAAAITVATAAFSSLTLAPAILVLLGRRIDSRAVRKPVAERGGDADAWHRCGRPVEHHPWRFLATSLLVAVVLAIPLLSIQLGHIGAGANPASYADHQAYDLLSSAFGPGENGPFTIVVTVPKGESPTVLGNKVSAAFVSTRGVAKASALTASPDGALLVGSLLATSGPQAPATFYLYHRLVNSTLPQALRSTGALAYVTGHTAAQFAFVDLGSARLPLIIALVLLLAFLLLLLGFRSLLLALKAAVLNLFSIGAAYGVIVAVFQ